MTATRQAVIVQGEDSPEMRALVQAFQEQHVTAGVVTTEDGETFALPVSILHALDLMVTFLARGGEVSITPLDREYPPAEAAFLLGVTQAYLLELLDSGAIPYRSDETQRLIAAQDVLAYGAGLRERRSQGVRAIQQLSEEEGAYDG
jgi:hypothetical protein